MRSRIQFIDPSSGTLYQWTNPNGSSYTEDVSVFQSMTLLNQLNSSTAVAPDAMEGKYWLQGFKGYAGNGTISRNILLIGDTFASDIASRVPEGFTDGRTVRSIAVDGDTSYQTAFRFGALPTRISLNGDKIPASGGVTLTIIGEQQNYPGIGLMQNGQSIGCTINGIQGVLSRTNGFYTFTRNANGSVVSVTSAEPLIVDRSTDREIVVIWTGRQNYTDVKRVLADIASIVDLCDQSGHPWVIMNIINGDYSSEYVGENNYNLIILLNQLLMSTYPGKISSVREAIIENYNPSISQDVIDHNHDVPASSLRRDQLYYNSYGIGIIIDQLSNDINIMYPQLADGTN